MTSAIALYMSQTLGTKFWFCISLYKQTLSTRPEILRLLVNSFIGTGKHFWYDHYLWVSGKLILLAMVCCIFWGGGTSGYIAVNKIFLGETLEPMSGFVDTALY